MSLFNVVMFGVMVFVSGVGFVVSIIRKEIAERRVILD